MGVSINWLKQYIDIEWTPEELAHRLTMAGIAVEGVEESDADYIMELDLTPNRGDCLGVINLAREVAALNGKELRIPQVKIKENRENINDYIKVEIAAPDLCPRYAARMIKNQFFLPQQTKSTPFLFLSCLGSGLFYPGLLR
jgi:phenylalanyl-tRNA synthetase beta chain